MAENAKARARQEATYFDAPDLRLTRAGISLRHRTGEAGPDGAWTLKLSDGADDDGALRREELVVHTHPAAAARLLREHATEGGLDPFFESLTPAERLAMLLDHLDELPLRRHEIRGNPAGLLARIVDRIDALKSAGVTAADFGRWADEQAGGSRSERDSAAREREFAEIYELHDAMLRSAGAMDSIDGVIELTYQVGVENMRARMYSALGITEQGFSSGDACRVPWATEESQAASQ